MANTMGSQVLLICVNNDENLCLDENLECCCEVSHALFNILQISVPSLSIDFMEELSCETCTGVVITGLSNTVSLSGTRGNEKKTSEFISAFSIVLNSVSDSISVICRDRTESFNKRLLFTSLQSVVLLN